MKRWFGYVALVAAVFGILFGIMHRGQPVHQNSAWVANLSQGHPFATNQGVASSAQTATVNQSSVSADSTSRNSSVHTSTHASTAAGSSKSTGSTSQTVGSKTSSQSTTPQNTRIQSTATQTTTAKNTSTQSTTTQSTSAQKAGNGQTAASSQTTAAGSSSGTASQALPASTKLGTFTILVTLNHGAVQKADKVVPIVKGESLLWYMQKYFTITTIYNGDFVVSINGIKSQWTGVPVAERKPVDWFLYINNQKAPVGLADIIPRAGDVDVWDYHSWDPSTGQG